MADLSDDRVIRPRSTTDAGVRRLPAWCIALELAATVAILAAVFGPTGSDDNIGLGVVYLAMFLGGVAVSVAAVLTMVVLASRKEISWRDARSPLLVATIPLIVVSWAIQQLL